MRAMTSGTTLTGVWIEPDDRHEVGSGQKDMLYIRVANEAST